MTKSPDIYLSVPLSTAMELLQPIRLYCWYDTAYMQLCTTAVQM